MNANQIEMFMKQKGKYFDNKQHKAISERLERLTPERDAAVLATKFVNPTMNEYISIFFGEFGVDRFLIGQVGKGIGKLLLTACCGIGLIWWAIDMFVINGATKKANIEKLYKAMGD